MPAAVATPAPALTPTPAPPAAPAALAPAATSAPGRAPSPAPTAAGSDSSDPAEAVDGADGVIQEGSFLEGSFARFLALMPNRSEYREYLTYNNYEAARDSHGINVPGQSAGDGELKAYPGALSATGLAQGPWISGYSAYALTQIKNREHMVFGLGNMDQSVRVGQPPKTLEAARRRFDPDATETALRQCGECPEADRVDHLGVEFYSWGEDREADLARRHGPPAFDHLGRGGRIAVLDTYVLRTLGTQDMRDFIATYLGQGGSLGDDPDLLLATRAMDELGFYSTQLMDGGWSLGADEAMESYCPQRAAKSVWARVNAHFEESGDLDTYEVLGLGLGFDEDGWFSVLIFIYGDRPHAERNVETLQKMLATGLSVDQQRPWNEVFSETAVRHEGRALTAKLRIEEPGIWHRLLTLSDTFFWHQKAVPAA